MKNSLSYKIWDIVYPLGIYYVVASITMFFAQQIMGTSNENYMYCRILASLITIPFVYQFYKKDRLLDSKPEQKSENKEYLKIAIWIILIASCTSIGLNNLIQMSPFVTSSIGYQNASEAFYGSTILFELIGSALITPFLEELLYRGIIFKRLRKQMHVIPSVLISSFIFALMHFNFVQFVYAFVLGIVLALLMEKTGNMYAAVLGHITANAIAVIRTETGLLQNTVVNNMLNIALATVLLGIGIALLVFGLIPKNRREK